MTAPTTELTRPHGLAWRPSGLSLPKWRETPFACSYVAVLGLATIAFALLDGADQRAVLQTSSTNVIQLSTHPLFVLVSSALWVDGIGDYLFAAAVLVVVATVLERRIGTRRVLAVFASGHVGATLLTEGAVAFGVHAGLLPASTLSRLDVGVSYGLAALLAMTAGLLPGQLRVVGLLAAWGYLGLPLVTGQDMTSWGHAIALGIGVLCWLLLPKDGRRPSTHDDAGIGMMVRWSTRRWQERSSLLRPCSTIPTSPGPSSCSSTMMAMAPSG
jgi:hypothetical protein